MKLEIRHWTSHQNMIVYSFYYYCKINKKKFELVINENVPYNAAILNFDSFLIFFDYSDDVKFIDFPNKYNFYFKRSLKIDDYKNNVFPLNFQVNFSFKSLEFLLKLDISDLKNKNNRVEFFRALDYFNLFTNSSHQAMDIRKFPNEIKDNGGKIIFYSRLWNPDNHPDEEEKNRRILQNDFRIKACEIIKKNFKNSKVGILSDEFSLKNCPKKLLLSSSKTKKKNYIKELISSDIGIADDGLKDTPGWKIGEYLLYGKSVITTPINIEIANFYKNENYLKLSNRTSYEELPDKINELLKNKYYLQMAKNNKNWSDIYLHPNNYFNRLLSLID